MEKAVQQMKAEQAKDKEKAAADRAAREAALQEQLAKQQQQYQQQLQMLQQEAELKKQQQAEQEALRQRQQQQAQQQQQQAPKKPTNKDKLASRTRRTDTSFESEKETDLLSFAKRLSVPRENDGRFFSLEQAGVSRGFAGAELLEDEELEEDPDNPGRMRRKKKQAAFAPRPAVTSVPSLAPPLTAPRASVAPPPKPPSPPAPPAPVPVSRTRLFSEIRRAEALRPFQQAPAALRAAMAPIQGRVMGSMRGRTRRVEPEPERPLYRRPADYGGYRHNVPESNGAAPPDGGGGHRR